MKTYAFSTLLITVALFLAGCALGPNSSTVINPFDSGDTGSAPAVSSSFSPQQKPAVQVAIAEP